MSLQYLSGLEDATLGRNRKAKRQEKKTKRQIRKGKISPSESEEELSPVNESRVKKSKVHKKIRAVFKKKKEPITVEKEDFNEVEAEETTPEETEREENTENEEQGDGEGMGIIYPNVNGRYYKRKQPARTIGKLKKVKLKAKLKAKVKKAIDRRKNDKHNPKQKAAHLFAKNALLIQRGAFLAIILLGKALEHTPIKINLAKKMRDMWPTKGNQFKELWYKLGGEPDILQTQIEKATRSKLSGVGYVVTAATGASVATATPIIVKIMKILGKAKDFADKNPKLIATGQALAKKGLEKAAAKGKTAENYNKVSALATELTSALPPETQAKINEIRKSLPDKLVKGIQVKTEKEIEETKAAANDEIPNTSTSKNGLYIGLGAAALIGGYLVIKKKSKK